MSNPSIARNDRFGAALGMPNGAQVQVVALADVNGNLVGASGSGSSPIAVTSGSGAVTQLTYVSTSRATNNVGDSFDSTLLNTLAVDTNVTALTGGTAPTVTFFVERFGADAVWYRIWTSAAIAAPAATSVAIGPFPTATGVATGVLSQLTRFGWTIAGAPTGITFSASVIAR